MNSASSAASLILVSSTSIPFDRGFIAVFLPALAFRVFRFDAFELEADVHCSIKGVEIQSRKMRKLGSSVVSIMGHGIYRQC